MAGQDQTLAEPRRLTLEEQEEFLLNGKIVKEKALSVGVTRSSKATLFYKGMTHAAHVQTIDEKSSSVKTTRGLEVNFRDYYGFNIAAYRLDKLLGLNMTPASVKRKVRAMWAAVTWWVDDVAMMNLERVQDNIQPPNIRDWNQQMYIVRIVNQLIYDTDPNLGNLLITKDWKLWSVDRTRAFRPYDILEDPKQISRCDRSLLARLKGLNKKILKENLEDYLSGREIDGLDTRRLLIIRILDGEILKNGEDKVLYDLPQRD